LSFPDSRNTVVMLQHGPGFAHVDLVDLHVELGHCVSGNLELLELSFLVALLGFWFLLAA
jgi:hypothetical protein